MQNVGDGDILNGTYMFYQNENLRRKWEKIYHIENQLDVYYTALIMWKYQPQMHWIQMQFWTSAVIISMGSARKT